MFSTEKYIFEKISIKDGLPSSMITCILQDCYGFIWVGSFSGLCKYDGYRFKNYKLYEDPTDVYDSNIATSFMDSDNKLWFGTRKGKIIEYDNDNNIFLKYDITYPNKCIISSIVEDRYGNLWIGTSGNGIYKFNKKTKKSKSVKLISKNEPNNFISHIRSLYMKKDDDLIIGTHKNGIYILNTLNDIYDNISIFLEKEKSLISVHSIHHYLEDIYLILTSSKVLLINLKTKGCQEVEMKSTFKDGDVQYFKSELCDGKLWICLLNGGLIQFDIQSKIVNLLSDNSDSNYKIISIYKDLSGVFWLGTMGAGLYKVDSNRKKFYFLSSVKNFENELKMVNNLIIDKDSNLWIGTMRNGIFKINTLFGIDPQSSEIKCFLNNEYIRIIYFDSKKGVWIGTLFNGLFKYAQKKDSFENFNDLMGKKYSNIFTVSELQKNSTDYLILGTNENEIICFDIKTEGLCELSEIKNLNDLLKNENFSKLYIDSQNNIWISLLDQIGIYRIPLNDLSEKKYYPYDVGFIYEDNKKNMWFGTSHGLIKHENKTELIFNYTKKNGASSNDIYSIIEDKTGNIWVTTRETISKFDLTSESFRNYEFNDGLQNEEYLTSCCIDNNGTLYFGGLNGIDYFKPDEIFDNSHIPNIVITDFQLFNESVYPSSKGSFLTKSIEYTEEIILTYKENIFSFEFAALVFNNPQKNQYAYMMEGFDKDWVYCGTKRTATYTNLDPGEYIFRVKGSNNDGVWNEEGTSVKITISPPYWKTWWFKGLGALSLIAATGYSYKQRIAKLEKEGKIQKDFSRKLIDTQENEKKRIAHELHDTIAHDVLISKNKALLALKHENDNIKMKKALEEISELSSSTIADVRNIAYNLHPHQLERLGFTKTIKSIISDVSGSTNIHFIYESDDLDGVLSKESEINLFRAIQESISNIIKHSMATEVILKVSKSKNFISVLIADNGKGFDIKSKKSDQAKEGFGLSGIAERIKFMNGEIKIDSELDKGTSLKFLIPIVK